VIYLSSPKKQIKRRTAFEYSGRNTTPLRNMFSIIFPSPMIIDLIVAHLVVKVVCGVMAPIRVNQTGVA